MQHNRNTTNIRNLKHYRGRMATFRYPSQRQMQIRWQELHQSYNRTDLDLLWYFCHCPFRCLRFCCTTIYRIHHCCFIGICSCNDRPCAEKQLRNSRRLHYRYRLHNCAVLYCSRNHTIILHNSINPEPYSSWNHDEQESKLSHV